MSGLETTTETMLCIRTLFANERVIPVVGVVGVAKSSMRVLEFKELMAVLS